MKTLILVCVALAGCASALTAADSKADAPLEKAFFKDVPRRVSDGNGLRIWHGNKATAGQFPYYVAMYMDMNYFCGGSLIHPKWVLTAAHCVDGISIWTMFMGALSMQLPKEEGREVHISRGGLLHPSYDKSVISHDVGLVPLLHPVSLPDPSGRIGLIKLTPADQNYMGVTATVAGFGINSDDANVISQDLMYTTLTAVSTDVCYDRYGSADDSQICLNTAKGDSSSCSGDSGGPLVIYDANNVPTQIGATSFGASAGCTLGLPVGFSNLTNFIDWISQSTGLYYPFDTQPVE